MQDVAHWAIMCGAGLATTVVSYLAATQSTFDPTLIGMAGTFGLACFIWGGIMTIRNT